MRFPIQSVCALFVAGIALGLPGAVSAAGQEPAPDSRASKPSAIGQPLADASLDALRGGDSVVVVRVRDDGEVNGNHAENVTSGLNAIDGGAFSNAAGIITVIQNSGSNVLIQNGVAVNVQFTGPGP